LARGRIACSTSLLGALPRRTTGEARRTISWLIASVNGILYARRSFERRLVALARARGLDGVICGHFHIAAFMRRMA
jgi:UDP-2,3-diacylglucosamine pyrophosphatase LpxH